MEYGRSRNRRIKKKKSPHLELDNRLLPITFAVISSALHVQTSPRKRAILNSFDQGDQREIMRILSFYFLLQILSSLSSSLVIQSRDDNSLGTAVARDETNNDLLMIGTVLKTQYGAPIEGSLVKFECSITVIGGKDESLSKTSLETPQICTGGVVVNHGVNGIAMIAGMDGTQAVLQPLLQPLDGRSSELIPGAPIILPDKSIPVNMANGEGSYIFIALHDVEEEVYNSFTNKLTVDRDPTDDLELLRTYLNEIVQPSTASESPPQILKVDSFSGKAAFHTTLEVKGAKATISEMTQSEKYLIVGGSTNGSGPMVGEQIAGHHDWDGYIAFLNTATGQVEAEAIRIDTGENDYVNSICVDGGYLYIVGTTEGYITGGNQAGGAYVFKMEIATEQILWSRQFSGTLVEGLGCVVSEEPFCIEAVGCVISEHNVYVAGNVRSVLEPDGNGEQQLISTTETTDVFVSSLNPRDGESLWTKQLDSTHYFGSDREDHFVSLYMNSEGNVGVYFNSVMIGPEDEDRIGNDVVLVDMDKHTGEYEFDGEYGSKKKESKGQEDNNNMAIVISAIVLPIFVALLVFGYSQGTTTGRGAETPSIPPDHELSLQLDGSKEAETKEIV